MRAPRMRAPRMRAPRMPLIILVVSVTRYWLVKKLVSAPIQLAEILSEQYSSVFSTPLPAADISSNVLPENTLTDIIFTEEDLETAMVLAIPASAGHTARRRTERPECCAGGYCVTACSFYKLQQV